MDKRKLGYWIATALFAAPMLGGGVVDIVQPDDFLVEVADLGYPLYFFVMLGVAKVAGAIVLLLPKLPRLKEWAYAGFVIDLVAAFVSHMAVGHGIDKLFPPIAILGLCAASYALRDDSRRL